MLPHRLFLFLLMAVGAVAFTADSNSVPQCALDCQDKSPTSCSLTDSACLCADTLYRTALTGCIKSTCAPRDSLPAQRIHYNECGIADYDPYPVADPATMAPMILGTLLFTIRMVAKFMGLGGGWGSDDYTIIVSWVLAVIAFSLNACMVRYGFSVPMWDIVPADNITKAYKYFYIYVLVYKIQISLAKISVCLFLLRIFRASAFRYITYGMMGLNAAIAVTWVFADAFRCQPIHLAWDAWENPGKGHCMNFSMCTTAHAFVNIIVDASMVLMPMYEVAKLSLSLRKKLGVLLMFAMGGVLTLIGILRVVVLYQNHRWNDNPTVTLAPVIHWSTIEVQITIVCACLPITRAMLVWLFPGMVGATDQQSTPYPTPGGSKPGFGNRTPGDSCISKTVSYSVNYTRPQRRDSDSMLQLVEVEQHSRDQT